jgi:addiction module RelE/StbE family toxin
MIIRFTDQFRKQYKKADVRIRVRFDYCLDLFIKDPMSRELRNHPLHKELEGLHSIDITGDWRAMYLEKKNGVVVFFFVALGTHSQLYK